MEQKPFSMGVRAEHLQTMIDRSQYGKPAEEIGLEPADYKLAIRVLSDTPETMRGVYTFCMCPGGTVVAAASTEGMVVTNGMSLAARDGKNANSAVLVDVRPEDYQKAAIQGGKDPMDPLAGVDFQETYERLAFELGGKTYKAPAERLGDFLGKDYYKPDAAQGGMVEPSYPCGITWTDISGCLPDFVTDALKKAFPEFGKRIKGFDRPDTVLTAIESRSSSPVRIPRNEEGIAFAGFYPAGEGAGYAGGIVSAAVDGIREAEAIMIHYSHA